MDTFFALTKGPVVVLTRGLHTEVRRDGLQVGQPVPGTHDAPVRPQAARDHSARIKDRSPNKGTRGYYTTRIRVV